jgi:hypothetical protein
MGLNDPDQILIAGEHRKRLRPLLLHNIEDINAEQIIKMLRQ